MFFYYLFWWKAKINVGADGNIFELVEKSYYVVQAVADDQKRTLYIVTAFIGKKGYKKEASQFINAESPDATSVSETAKTPNKSISNSVEDVNTIISENDVKYSDREIAPITEADYKNIVNHFGTTGNFKVAGYLLTDGKLLDFSGKHWGDTYSKERQVDHRDIQEVLDRGNNGINDMIDMLGNGNIRLMLNFIFMRP